MTFTGPSAAGPASPDAIITQVRRQLNHDSALIAAQHQVDVDRVVEAAVRELWRGRVKAFVPILALREARAYLREHGDETHVRPRQPEHTAKTLTARAVTGDALGLDDDVLTLDAGDVIRL